MKIFFTLISLLVILLFSVNSFLVVNYWEAFLSTTKNYQITLSLLIAFMESIVMLVIIKEFFHDPIKILEYNIKNFLIWWNKGKETEIKKWFNPHINYIILFFNRTLKTLKSIKSEFLHGKAIKSEVELWKEIQWHIFNKEIILPPSLNIEVKSKPAWEIWWDSYDIIKQWDNYYIYVWDATWHWVWAGFLMMMTNALISWFAKMFERWDEILAKTNEVIKPRVKANLLTTLLLVRWNEKEQKLYLTWAWHEYLMIYKNSEKKCYKIKSWWIALWMVKDISKILEEKQISFERNDLAILYSDWITEAINKQVKDWSEEMFWEDRLVNAINKAPNKMWYDYKTADSVFNNITIELSKFMWYKNIQADDITLLVIENRWKDYEIWEYKTKDIPDEFITEWNWD